MEITVLNLLLGMVLMLGGLTLLMGYKWVNLRHFDPKVANKRLKQYLEYIEELEDDNKKLKGTISNSKRVPQIEINPNLLDSPDGVTNIITELLPRIIPSLPKPLQGLAQNPQVLQYALKLYKENPEQVKQLLGQFISKSKTGKSAAGSSIPEFDDRNAI